MISKSKYPQKTEAHNIRQILKYMSIFVFAFKLLIIFNIQGGYYEISGRPFFLDGIWLGADGENYLKGYEALSRDGLFSKDKVLNYWPAGYPLVILFLSLLGKSWVLTTLSIFQSLIFSYSVYFFALQIAKMKIKKFVYFSFLFIIFNPTLSLSSISVGYESLIASGFLILFALISKDLIDKNNNRFFQYLICTAITVGFITFLQPRFIISGILVNFFWIVIRNGLKSSVFFMIISLIISLFFPISLIYRNHEAVGLNSISTNLGATMNIGAGPTATGGYMKEGYGVPCSLQGTVTAQDNQKVKCVLDWYIKNPTKSLKLFFNKTVYFWSPWINNGFAGEVNTGTMFRNPWLKISPLTNIAANQDGANLIYGPIGKLISWLWLICGLILMFYGYYVLWSQKFLERFIASLALTVITTNWIISLITIGDHRFRVPIMGMSLFLQAIGFKTLFSGGKVPKVNGPSLR